MANQNSTSPREQALHHLREALASGIRGVNREAIQYAIEVLEDNGQGGLRDIHYRNLKEGGVLSDPKRPGLRMRANKRRKVWLYRYRNPLDNRLKEISIGTYPDTSLADARVKWEKFKALRDSGRDVEAALTEEGKAGLTVEALCRRYVTEYAKPNKRSWKDDERQLQRDMIRAYGTRRALDITRDDIEQLLDQVLERGSPRGAEKLLAVVRKMFNHAIKKGWVTGLTENPCKGIELNKREVSSTHLTESQIKSFVRNLPKLQERDEIKHALLLQFQTVARIGEVIGLRWTELDVEHGIWNLPAERSKNGEPHRVMLSKQSLEMLKERSALSDQRPQKDDRSLPYVFPSVRDIRRPIRVDYVLEVLGRNRKRLGIPDSLTSHGLRHTALTQLASMGCGKEMRDRIANHKDSSLDSLYQHYEYDEEAREWLQKWADRLDAYAIDNAAVLKRKEANRE